MRVSKWLAGREQWCYFLVSFLHFALGSSLPDYRFKVTREQHPRIIETVVIPPVSRKEVNFKHVSRQERRKKKFLRPELEA